MAPLGVILAGGRSRRFGAPKALARVGGRRIVDRVRDALAAAVPRVVLVANEPGLFDDVGLPVRPDAVPGLGALGGVRTALRWAREEGMDGALVVACDLPFVSPALLRILAARAEATDADAVIPESRGRLGVEPLCAWYGVRALPVVDAMLQGGERRMGALLDRLRTARIPLAEVASAGDPLTLFLNVNTVEDLGTAERLGGSHVPPVVCIVGRKNSGKTTLAVALLAEFRRRGWRVASVKHGHHDFETDQPGRDSWRHFHEGQAEATLMAGAGKIALVMRMEGDPDPERLVRDFYAGRGYDLVLIEGYKSGPFPRVEVFRRAVHDEPVYDAGDPDAARLYLAIATDDAALRADVPIIRLDGEPGAGEHVGRIADLVAARLVPGRAHAG